MKNYDLFYQKLSEPFRVKESRVTFLVMLNRVITSLMYAIYPLLLVYLWLGHRHLIVPYLLIPMIGFVLVSLIRKVLQQPRPYEQWAIVPLIDRSGTGDSFPSRHVFSATLISCCLLWQIPWLGAILIILSAVLAYCRVVGGVHYPKDVIVGLVLGILNGLVLLLWQ